MTQRIAVVTGGIGGLGSEICKRLARSGRRVVAADLGAREDRIAQFLAEVADYGDQISFAPINVGDFEDCAQSLEKISQDIGPIDILVNSAGITRDVTLRKMDVKQWNDVLRVNLDGAFNTC